jgi:plastocyanin
MRAKRTASVLAAAAMVLGLSLPARAGATQVEMTQQFTFNPTPIAVAQGDSVLWTNVSSFQHTATQNAGFFDTGVVDQEQSKSKVFKWAGGFPYQCIFHGPSMHGKISVPAKWATPGEQHPGDEQRIRIATEAAPAPLAFDVQMRKTGDADWSPYRQKIKNAVVKFTPTAAGEYQFRSRVHRLSNNKVSGWSPAAFVEIVA